MTLHTRWTEKMSFTSSIDGHSILMDAARPIGNDSAMTPKMLVVAGLTGCTAMDVIALLKKYKQPVQTFDIEAEVRVTKDKVPSVFEAVTLTFRLTGTIDTKIAVEAVRLSQTKYCGVSKMLAKSFPIHYAVVVNGETIATGDAHFD